MESLPNNSFKAQSDKKPVTNRKVEQIEGSAATHKPTIWKMLRSSFIPENMTFMDVVADIVMPAIRDVIFDTMTGSIDYWRSGVGGYSYYNRKRDMRSDRGSHVNYNRMSSSRMDQKYEDKRTISKCSSYDDIFLRDGHKSNGEFISGVKRASEVLAMCDDDIRDYGYCTVADFLEHCKMPSSENGSDFNWGWSNLDRATIKPAKGGAVIIMPDPLPIES